SHPEELQLLAKDMLISVTQFFRDPEAFEALKTRIADYVSGQPGGAIVRAWIPACGTGEEAYSIAILIAECLEDLKQEIKVKIFGTDVDAEAIARARAGNYSENIAGDISPARLRRFFVREQGGYRVRKEIREMIVYAVQDLTKDPPFTKLDILSCRNLLIYFEPELQARLLPLFHYSLKPGGLLFLGSSESIGKYSDQFETADKKWKIFRSKRVYPAVDAEPWTVLPWVRTRPLPASGGASPMVKETDLSLAAQRVLLESFAPPSVVANEAGEIFYIHGQTGRYLEPAQGRPNWNVFEMARDGLRFELRSGTHYALIKGKERRYESLLVRADHEAYAVNVVIRPFGGKKNDTGLVIITFEDVAKPGKRKPEIHGRRISGAQETRLRETERELAYTRESLQATIEELQAANEELKSTNEEMQSTNEELQSTNEELETSREELQSMNEELVTVNAELQAKIDALSQTENDMKILLENTNIGVIFLDDHLVIKRFTTEVTRVFKLIPGDVGRPIHDIRSNLEYDDVEEDARKVIETHEQQEKEIRTKDGERYLMRVMPYRTAEAGIGGVVLTFTNITWMKK
ncbi:MAG TPA: CheR family methyltransferase, partial [Acidobacteriota bacterium]|nr:CheR family methyltransferase [Acidobacteriota bacterium]